MFHYNIPLTRVLLVAFLASMLLLPGQTPVVEAAAGDLLADAVLGQPDFDTNSSQPPSATTLSVGRRWLR